MKFFRRKDKKKSDSDTDRSHGRMPGFGGSSFNNGKHSAPVHSGYGFGDSPRPDRSRPFGSPPSDHDRYNSGGTGYAHSGRFQPRPSRASAELLAQFPPGVFERIFTFVCPHSRDETYVTCEQSSVEDGCMLCDLRDLARCVAVCRRWKTEAVKSLYVEVIHYPYQLGLRPGVRQYG
jgi:hypothetical protein